MIMKITSGPGIVTTLNHSGSMSGLVSFDNYTKQFNLVDPMSGAKQNFYYDVGLSLDPRIQECIDIIQALKNNPNTKQALEELLLLSKLGT